MDTHEFEQKASAFELAGQAPQFDCLSLLLEAQIGSTLAAPLAQDLGALITFEDDSKSHPSDSQKGTRQEVPGSASEGGALIAHLLNFDKFPQGKTTDRALLAQLAGQAAADKIESVTRKGNRFTIDFKQPPSRIENKEVDKKTGKLVMTGFVSFEKELSFNLSKLNNNGVELTGIKGVRAESVSGVKSIGHAEVETVSVVGGSDGKTTVTATGTAHIGIVPIGIQGTRKFVLGPNGERLQ